MELSILIDRDGLKKESREFLLGKDNNNNLGWGDSVTAWDIRRDRWMHGPG